VLAVVEDHLEHPADVLDLRVGQDAGAVPIGIE